MKRRGFLGGLSAVFAATPEKILKASGVSISEVGSPGSALVGGLTSGAVSSAGQGAKPWWLMERAKLLALQTVRPQWFEKKRRMQARYVHVLDIDLASMRSVSPSAKIAMQRERNYQKSIEREFDSLDIYEGEDGFKL